MVQVGLQDADVAIDQLGASGLAPALGASVPLGQTPPHLTHRPLAPVPEALVQSLMLWTCLRLGALGGGRQEHGFHRILPEAESPHFVLKNNSLVTRKRGEQLRSQIETCGEEFPSERLPSRSLIGPRGSWFGIQAASPEGISSCSGPGARTATAAQDILLLCAGVVSVPHCHSVNADWL